METYFELIPEELIFEIILYIDNIDTLNNLLILSGIIFDIDKYKRLVNFLISKKGYSKKTFMFPPKSIESWRHILNKIVDLRSTLVTNTVKGLIYILQMNNLHNYSGKSKDKLIDIIVENQYKIKL